MPPKTRLAPGSFLALALFFTSSTISLQPGYAETSRLDQMHAREYINQGNLHLARREFQKAIDAYTECLLIDPRNQTAKDNIVVAHNTWGIWYFQQKKYNEAKAEWEQALKLSPTDRGVRQNLQVLKMTLAKLGLTGEEQKASGGGADKPKEGEPQSPPSAVMILTPGLKQSVSSSSSSDAGASTGGAEVKGSSASSTTSSSSSSSSSTPASSSASSTPPSSASVSVYTDTTPRATTGGGSSPTTPPGGNIESRLSAIELKIYGKMHDEQPVLKRLERLEMDTHGKVRVGTIQERIENLRQSYGL
ncbi:MAG TPA: tetratricopeptide repeat protein [Candidatus Obscuribacterales bacterium]